MAWLRNMNSVDQVSARSSIPPTLIRAMASGDAPRLRQKSDRFIWSYLPRTSGDGHLGSVTSPSSPNIDQTYFSRMPFRPSERSSTVNSYGHSTYYPGLTRSPSQSTHP